jgi:hypothetical protein
MGLDVSVPYDYAPLTVSRRDRLEVFLIDLRDTLEAWSPVLIVLALIVVGLWVSSY